MLELTHIIGFFGIIAAIIVFGGMANLIYNDIANSRLDRKERELKIKMMSEKNKLL